MKSLFTDDSPPVQPEPPSGPFALVALEQAVDKQLHYSIPPQLRTMLQVGQRVSVPLGRGNRRTYGYIVGIDPVAGYPRIKPLLGIDDARVLVDAKLMALSRWMSRYYCCPLGTVLESVIPSAVKKRVGLGQLTMVRLAVTPNEAQAALETIRSPKRRAVLARLLQLKAGESIELARLAGESGVRPPTIKKMVVAGLLHIEKQADLAGLTPPPQPPRQLESDIALNSEQAEVFNQLAPRMRDGGFSVNLLLGVTGSGKTEVYLQCLRQVIERGRQAIVLVPEIALTPQTVRRFTGRFTNVAILHSGLSAGERHRQWQMISQGQAQVVVGARSAIFAPLPNLGAIVVDEEHEASYKQDTAPRYQGRDVAIKRAQLENVPILLGSATPSLETYWKVKTQEAASSQSSYHLLNLPHRVRGLAMPVIELVNMKEAARYRRGIHLLTERLEHLLHSTLQNKHQAILLLNRRGYANFVYCPSCQTAIQCKYCDATMTYHRAAGMGGGGGRLESGLHTGQLHCHYCLAVNPLPATCPQCNKRLTLFGLGTQRVEEELKTKFPDLRFERVDSDTMHNSRDYEKLLNRFAAGEIQVLLGTQMIAKGLDYPNVTLVGVISGDTALSLPDFRAAERTFQLITQVAGRAGRGDSPGRVVVQTFMPEDLTIQSAISQDYSGFAARELLSRQEVGLPPYARMVRLVMRDQDPLKLQKLAEQIAATVLQLAAAEPLVAVKGPMPCAISRIAGYHRSQIVMTCRGPEPMQRILLALRIGGDLARSERIAVDVDPTSLL